MGMVKLGDGSTTDRPAQFKSHPMLNSVSMWLSFTIFKEMDPLWGMGGSP